MSKENFSAHCPICNAMHDFDTEKETKEAYSEWLKLEAENKTLETKNLEITEKYNSMGAKRMELMGRYNTLRDSRHEALMEINKELREYQTLFIELLVALEEMFELGFDDRCEPPFVTRARAVIKKAEALKGRKKPNE